MIVSGIMGLAKAGLAIFGNRTEAAQKVVQTRIDSMSRTWTDEILVVFWFAPTIVGWFSTDKGAAMIDLMTRDKELLGVQLLITGAVFGLGKMKRPKLMDK